MAVMYVIGTVGFTGGNVIYYSFMPYLAEKRCMDHVSSKGYAYGFMGLYAAHFPLGNASGSVWMGHKLPTRSNICYIRIMVVGLWISHVQVDA